VAQSAGGESADVIRWFDQEYARARSCRGDRCAEASGRRTVDNHIRLSCLMQAVRRSAGRQCASLNEQQAKEREGRAVRGHGGIVVQEAARSNQGDSNSTHQVPGRDKKQGLHLDGRHIAKSGDFATPERFLDRYSLSLPVKRDERFSDAICEPWLAIRQA